MITAEAATTATGWTYTVHPRRDYRGTVVRARKGSRIIIIEKADPETIDTIDFDAYWRKGLR